jgi:prophage maintenance system killer protein
MPPITVEVLLAIHNNMLQDFPATAGFQNADKKSSFELELILTNRRDFSCFFKAALICNKIISYKPFNSLNKRMAMSIISLYLKEAGLEFTASSLEALQFVNNIENGLPLDQIEAFITENSKPL